MATLSRLFYLKNNRSVCQTRSGCFFLCSKTDIKRTIAAIKPIIAAISDMIPNTKVLPFLKTR